MLTHKAAPQQQQLLPLRDAGPDPAVAQPAAPPKLRRARTGKACRRCANIKCKCIRPVEGLPCERCRRLKAACEPALTMSMQRAATTQVRAAPRSRTARLEARIDDLVNLLQTARTPPQPQPQPQLQPQSQMQLGHLASPRSTSSPAGSGPPEEGTSGTSGLHSRSSDLNSPVDKATPSGHSETGTVKSTAATTPTEADPCQNSLPLHEAESRLRLFREEMLPLAPFHYIPPTTTVDEIIQKSPFLWLCIRIVTDPSPFESTRLALQCRRVIIRRVVEEDERSMDILLGLLTFLSWNNMPFHGPAKSSRSFITLLSQVVIAVTWDLGLTTPPSTEPGHGGLTPGRFIGPPPPRIRRSEPMDERRVVLGVFLVTLNVSQKYRSGEGLQWSPYLESCLAYLDKHSTVPQDVALVQIIKMHLLVNQMFQAPTAVLTIQHSTVNKQGSPALDGPRNIPVPFIESMRAELGAIVKLGPDGTSPSFENFTVHNLYHFSMLSIHETVLFPSPPTQTFAQLSSLWATSDLQRFEMLQRCLRSVKTVMDSIFAWPLEKYAMLPSSSLMLLCPMFRWLYKLTTLRDSVWNPETARSIVDPIATLDGIIDRCKSFSSMHFKQNNPKGFDASHGRGKLVDLISASVARFSAFKRAWQSDLAAHAQGANGGNRAGTESDSILPTVASGGTGSTSCPLPPPPGIAVSSVPTEMPPFGDDFSFLFADGMQNYQLDFSDMFQIEPNFMGESV